MIRPALLSARPAAGSAPYHASAVHFDGNTWLSSANSLGAIDGPLGILSFWCRQSVSGGLQNYSGGKQAAILDTFNDIMPIQAGSSESSNDSLGWILQDIDFQHYEISDTAGDTIGVDVWEHNLLSWNLTGESLLVAYYKSRIKVEPALHNTTGGPINVGYNDTSWSVGTFGLSYPSRGIIGDLADINLITTATIVQGDGTIADSNLNKFITLDGKPTDPTSTGFTSLFLLSGDADSFGDNLANTGSFSVVSGGLTNAVTSPSD